MKPQAASRVLRTAATEIEKYLATWKVGKNPEDAFAKLQTSTGVEFIEALAVGGRNDGHPVRGAILLCASELRDGWKEGDPGVAPGGHLADLVDDIRLCADGIDASYPPEERDSANDPRDLFIYKSRAAGKQWKWIKSQVSKRKRWDPLTSIPGLRRAAEEYATRKNLTWPPKK